MKIDQQKCVQCKRCIPYCPVQAIISGPRRMSIDQTLCVECSVCYRSQVCRQNALVPFSKRYSSKSNIFSRIKRKLSKVLNTCLAWTTCFIPSRRIREIFSDPLTTSRLTHISGRGTAEIKTNDITGRYQEGEIGFCFEIGRPGVGATIKEVEKFTVALAELGVFFEPDNPMTQLMKNAQGCLQEKYHDERVLSAIIECKVACGDVASVLDLIKKLDKETNAVFTVGVISAINASGEIPVLKEISECGLIPSTHSKINVGLAIQSGENG